MNEYRRNKSMKRASASLSKALEAMGGDPAQVRKAMRANQVRHMWQDLMEANHDEGILMHTNSVYIIRRTQEDYEQAQGRLPHAPANGLDDKKDSGATGYGKQLIVYVDDSMVASELNARRELIKLQFASRYGEILDEFKIFISRGQYRNNYPFRQKEAPSYSEDVPSIPLTAEERASVHERVQAIEDPKLRALIEKTMTADLEWKKGIAAAKGQQS